jgi:hypothetical protein
VTPALTAASASNEPTAVSWADAWQAWGSLIAAGVALLTLEVAVIAAAVAWRQLGEARRLRREQAQA